MSSFPAFVSFSAFASFSVAASGATSLSLGLKQCLFFMIFFLFLLVLVCIFHGIGREPTATASQLEPP